MTTSIRSMSGRFSSRARGGLLMAAAMAIGAAGVLSGTAFAGRETNGVALQSLARQYRAAVMAGRTSLYYDMLRSTDPAQLALNQNPDMQLMFIRKNGMPAYYLLNNLNAAKSVRTYDVWPLPVGGGFVGLTGSTTAPGELAIWDGNGVLTTHQEFQGRVTQMDVPSGTLAHSTHVAGTMVAAGINSSARGMSYAAPLHAYDWNFDTAEMAVAAANGLQASNHSYGYAAGWEGSYWYGDLSVNTTEDYGFGFYDGSAQEFDAIAYAAPNYLICVAAGNDRNDPAWGGTHFHWNGFSWVSATDSHGDDFQSGGYDTISYTGNAKNILTVGAVNDIPLGYTVPGDVVQTAFSSWGPTDDGRIKPDIVANGAALFSCTNTGTTAYTNMSGTSMATPNASGSVNLISHEYEKQFGKIPHASTVKALVINTADEAGATDGPDYANGWGLLNTLRAIQVLNMNGAEAGGVWETTLNAGETHEYSFTVDSPQNVRLTIAWTDPQGASPPVSLDPPTKMLVDDLDLRITNVTTGITTEPWRLSLATPAAAATRGDNNVDNVEQIDIASAPAGRYTVTINHKGVLFNNAQDYAMVWRGMRASQPTEFVGGGSAYIDLAVPNVTAPNHAEDRFQEQGVFITAIRSVAVNAVAMKLAVPCPTPFTVSLYNANGTTRGSLVATAGAVARHPGEIFQYVPIAAFLSACHDYELVFHFNETVSWPSWNEPAITEPYDMGGAIRVRDGALAGVAASPVLGNFAFKGAVLPDNDTELDAGIPWSTVTSGAGATGVYISADRTVTLDHVAFHVGFPPNSVVNLYARVYAASGTTRGPLIAEGYTRYNSGPGSAVQLHVIPVKAVLEEGEQYDIEVAFPANATWEFFNESGVTPFAVGPLRMFDAEASGAAAATSLAHLHFGWTEMAGGAPFDLSKSGPNPPPFTSTSTADRGMYVTALFSEELYSLGWMADVPAGDIIGMRVYQASGTARGALVSQGQIVSSGAGTRWHDVPVSASLVAGGDYDFEIDITSVNSWGYWNDTSGLPYTAYGILQVRDAEQGSDATYSELPRMRMNACDAALTPVRGGPGAAPMFTLATPYPNPVTGVATIDFSLERDDVVSVLVYDISGRRVATLLDNASRGAGSGSVIFDAKGLASGVYFVKLQTPAKSVSRKITIVK